MGGKNSVILALVIALSILTNDLRIEASVLQSKDDPPQTYGVIVDCGSSGTRAHIFEWDERLEYPELLHDIAPKRDGNGKPITMKITPGLSSLNENPERASDYMQPIVDFILANIPEDGQKSTGIYILGTAGMRLLDEETQLRIMNDIALDLAHNYNFAKIKTKVISGAEEGMYQWITVNSKLQRFIQRNPSPRHVQVDTFGVVEIGGASIQITFQLKPGMKLYIDKLLGDDEEAKQAFHSQIVEPNISRETREHSYRLVSTTFLGLGSNSAREAYVDLLVMSRHFRMHRLSHRMHLHNPSKRYMQYTEKEPLLLADPCLPEGSEQTMERPIRMFKTKGKTCGYTVDDDDITFHVKLVGSSDYKECNANILKMFKTIKRERLNCKPDEPCTMSLLGTPFVPYFAFELFGLSELYYTANEMLDEAGEFNWTRFTTKTNDICGMRYSDLLKKYPNANRYDKTRVTMECFKANFMDVFLTYGLGMPKVYEMFKTIKEIKGDELEWTLGAVLDNSMAIDKATELAQKDG